jgi:hypothetical protein
VASDANRQFWRREKRKQRNALQKYIAAVSRNIRRFGYHAQALQSSWRSLRKLHEPRIAVVMDAFKVRLNCIDYYQATPAKYDPQLRNDVAPEALSKEPKVPVIRVFGSTQTGQKVCAHIHGAFPYLYIEYTGSLAPEEGEWRTILAVASAKSIF